MCATFHVSRDRKEDRRAESEGKKTVFADVRVFPKGDLEHFVHWWEIFKSVLVGCSSVECRAGLLNCCTIAILGRITLCHRNCPVHDRVFISISGLYPLDVSRTSHGCDNQKCPQILANGIEGEAVLDFL